MCQRTFRPSLITYNQRVADYLAGRYQKELGLGADARNERFIQSNYLDLSQLENIGDQSA